MKRSTGFWIGVGAGLVAGAAVGMMTPDSGRSMKTQVGKRIQRLGLAVDHAVDNIMSDLR